MIIIHLIVSALAIGIAAYLVPGVTLAGPWAALVVAVVLALINIFIRPILVILTLPVNIITLGLFSLVINAVLVMLAGSIVQGFTVAGFWPALIFSIVLSLITMVFGLFS
jgi:putative membrane protein